MDMNSKRKHFRRNVSKVQEWNLNFLLEASSEVTGKMDPTLHNEALTWFSSTLSK